MFVRGRSGKGSQERERDRRLLERSLLRERRRLRERDRSSSPITIFSSILGEDRQI